MINDNNLKELFENILINNDISTIEIYCLQMNQYDISKLINNNLITRVKRGSYSVTCENLFNFCQLLINNKDYDLAYKYLLKCIELDYNYIDKFYNVFCDNILNNNIDLVCLYFDVLSYYENDYISNINLYMYLLSFIVNIPDKYKGYIKNLELDDLIDDNNIDNNIIKNIYFTKFNQSFSSLNDNNKDNQVLKTLLARNINVDRNNRLNILNLVKENKYKELKDYLKNKENTYNLTLLDSKVYLLLDSLFYIISSGKIPKVEIDNTNNIFKAIDGNNYKLALSLSNEYNKINNIDNDSNVIYLLLKEICKEIDNLSYYFDIIIFLMKKNFDKVNELIDKYLKFKNKNEYNILLKKSIDISINENDYCFRKFINMLSEIDRNSFVFNLNEYIENFYLSLSKNNIIKANLYLDIILDSRDAINNEELKNNLINVLNNSKNIIKNNEVTVIEKKRNNKEIVVINENEENDRLYLVKKHKLLVENKGILVLKNLNNKKRKAIHMLSKNYEDMVCFNIGEDNDKKIVLRYKVKSDEFIDLKKLTKQIDAYYYSKNYEECLKCLFEMLSFGFPKSYVYGRIGLIYVKLNKYDLALDYLETASYVNKKENKLLDYSEIIDKIKNKKNIEIDEKLFNNKGESFIFRLDNIEKIKDYINESGLDIDSACLKLNFSAQQTNLIKLSIAQDYYSQNNFTKGDEFVLSVEKSKDKSKMIINYINELRRNKRFYSNRENVCTKKLTYSLKINK